MIQIKDETFITLLNFFYSDFFNEGLVKAVEDDEVSAVTQIKGMEFFIELVKEYNIDFPYKSVKDYIVNSFDDGEEMYKKLMDKYNEEIKTYKPKDKSFEEMFGNTHFI